MMQGVNIVVIVGNATRDADHKFLPSGLALCSWGMASNHKWKSRDGEAKEEVCFVDCTAFGPIAELCAQRIRKGVAVMVTGRLRYETWEASDGTRRSRHTVTADQVRFFGNPSEPIERAAASQQPTEPADVDDTIPF